MILGAMQTVALLLVGLSMTDTSTVMTQTERGYPGPPGWMLDVGLTSPHKKYFLEKLSKKRC
jgi:hypothetical protein